MMGAEVCQRRTPGWGRKGWWQLDGLEKDEGDPMTGDLVFALPYYCYFFSFSLFLFLVALATKVRFGSLSDWLLVPCRLA